MASEIVTDKIYSTVELFWTPEMLEKFKHKFTNINKTGKWATWVARCFQIQSPRKVHWKTEQQVENDINELFHTAESGCQLQLIRHYARLLNKSMYANNELASYLADVWDCISTAQVLCAKTMGVHIEWTIDTEVDFYEYYNY